MCVVTLLGAMIAFVSSTIPFGVTRGVPSTVWRSREWPTWAVLLRIEQSHPMGQFPVEMELRKGADSAAFIETPKQTRGR